MAIKPVLHYRNPDSTYDLNSSQARIVDRAIFDGGALTLSGTSLDVTVDPFIVAGYDGMVAISDSSETLSVIADGNDYYLILHLEYRTLTAALANLLVVPSSTWSSSVSKNFFVTFARFNVPAGSSALTDPGVVVDYSVGDWADKLGKTGWRSPVANSAALPTEGNRDGDSRLVLDTYTAYSWQAGTSSWTVVGGALDIGETLARAQEMDAEELRSFNGSGYVGSLNLDPSGKTHNGTYGRLAYIPTPTVQDNIGLDSMKFVVNGHFGKTPYNGQFSLPAAPALGERHDLLYLDVHRELLSVPPASVTYAEDNTLGGFSTFVQVRDRLEQLLENSSTPNSGFAKIEAVDSTTFVVTRWEIKAVSSVPAGSTADISLAAAWATNVDGANYSVAPVAGGAVGDYRVWTASSATPFDGGVSWAIPLLIIRRTDKEAAGNYVQETRSDTNDERFIFDVCPRAELGHGMTEALSALASSGTTAASVYADDPSGFLSGTDAVIVPGASTLTVSSSTVSVRGRVLRGGTAIVTLSSIPAVAGQPNFDLIVLEVHTTANPPGNYDYVSGEYLSRAGSQGVRSLRAYGKFVVHRVNTQLHLASSDSDETRVMTDGTISTGPYSLVGPGLWSRNSVLGSEDSAKIYAIPVALVNRRVSGVWDPATAAGRQMDDRSNFPGLPNNPASTPYASEVLDLRHRLIRMDEADRIAEESFSKLLHGNLRTKFSYDKGGSGTGTVPTFGTQLLQVDEIKGTAVPSVGSFSVTPSPDGVTSIWSEADEAHLLSYSFTNPTIDNSSSPVFSWSNIVGTTGDLTITAPAGMHLNLDQFLGDLPASPNNAFLTVVDPAVGELNRYKAYSFSSNLLADADSNPTVVEIVGVDLGVLMLNTSVVFLQVWAVKPSRLSSTYSTNFSLFATPDEVHRVELRNGVADKRINVGPILKTIRASIVGNTATITQNDLYTALGGAGNEYATLSTDLKMYGVSHVALVGEGMLSATNKPKLTNVLLTDGLGSFGNSSLVLVFSAGLSATFVDVQVMFEGDLISSWVEINPTAKGVRGLYSWHDSTVTAFDALDRSLVDTSVNPVPPGSSVVPLSEVGVSTYGISGTMGLSSNSLVPAVDALLYYKSATSYDLWTDTPPAGVVGQFMFNSAVDSTTGIQGIVGSWSSSAGTLVSSGNSGNSFYLVCAVRTPLLSTDSLRLFYSYTPYQGLSPDALTTVSLASYLHGEVSAVCDSTLTTRGPNTPSLHPRELTLVGYSDVPYVERPLSSIPTDMGFPTSSGISFGVSSSVGTATGLVRVDNEDLSYRQTDLLLKSPISHFPSFYSSFPSSLYPGELALRGTYITTDQQPNAYSLAVPLTSSLVPSGSSWSLSSGLSLSSSSVPPSSHDIVFSLPFLGAEGGVLATGGYLTHVFLEVFSSVSGNTVEVGIYKSVPGSSTLSLVALLTNISVSGSITSFRSAFFGSIPLERDVSYSVVVTAVVNVAASVSLGSLRVRVEPPIGTDVVYPPFLSDSGILLTLSGHHPLPVGSVVSSPYSSADLSSLLSAYSVTGRQDYSSSLRRGIHFKRTSPLKEDPLFDSYSFLPGESPGLRTYDVANYLTSNTVGSLTGVKLPLRSRPSSFLVSNLASSSPSYPGAVAMLDGWLIRTIDSAAMFGASTGIRALVPSKSYASGGSTVDAFYPVGRPLFRKTK